MPTLYHNHGNFDKSIIIFSEIFIDSYQPESKQTFSGKILYVSFLYVCLLFPIQHKNSSKI